MVGKLGLAGWFLSMGASPQDYVALVIWQLALCRVSDLNEIYEEMLNDQASSI